VKKPAHTQLYRIPDFNHEVKAYIKELKLKTFHIGGVLYDVEFPTEESFIIFQMIRQNLTIEEVLKEGKPDLAAHRNHAFHEKDYSCPQDDFKYGYGRQND